MWVQFVAHHKGIGNNVLRLMRHPDATPEQVWELHLKYTEVMQKYNDLRKILCERYPDNGAYMMMTPPWHYKEI
jgi:hypothetical protein